MKKALNHIKLVFILTALVFVIHGSGKQILSVKQLLIFIVSFVVLIFVLLFTAALLARVTSVFIATFDFFYNNTKSLKFTNLRLFLSNTRTYLIQKDIYYGLNTRYISTEMRKCYIKKHMSDAYVQHIGSHNQLIKTFVTCAVIYFDFFSASFLCGNELMKQQIDKEII